MPKFCSVYGCVSSSDTHPNLSFFQSPSDRQLLRSWLVRIRRENFNPRSTFYICSRHFLETDYAAQRADTPAVFRRVRLKKGTMPTLNLRGTGEIPEPPRNTKTAARAEGLFTESTEVLRPLLLEETENTDTSQPSPSISMQDEIVGLKKELEGAGKRIGKLESKVFCYENLSDVQVREYTNIDRKAFRSLVILIDCFQPLSYWSGSDVVSINKENQLLIFIAKLKIDLPYFDLANKYSVSKTTIQNIFMTYLDAVHEILLKGMMQEIPSLAKNREF